MDMPSNVRELEVRIMELVKEGRITDAEALVMQYEPKVLPEEAALFVQDVIKYP